MENKTNVTYVHLTIEKDVLEETRKAAEEEDERVSGDGSKSLMYGDDTVRFQVDEAYIDDDGQLNLSGEIIIRSTGKSLGYASLNVQMSNDVLIGVIRNAVGLYNKVKTVLEATK